jgi:hypothetical protein
VITHWKVLDGLHDLEINALDSYTFISPALRILAHLQIYTLDAISSCSPRFDVPVRLSGRLRWLEALSSADSATSSDF